MQEIESIRGELSALRTGGSGSGAAGNTSRGGGHVSWDSFRASIPGLSNPGRVKKLTQFFGDEPPLVRIFLRKLGYEVRFSILYYSYKRIMFLVHTLITEIVQLLNSSWYINITFLSQGCLSCVRSVKQDIHWVEYNHIT